MLYDLFDPEDKITVNVVTLKKHKRDINSKETEYQKTVKLSSMDLDDDLIDDLIDEDDLLDSYNLLMSGLTTNTSVQIDKKDCKTSRKACMNCSCGRAEGLMKNESNSMCGNCYLGDGFRCESCPSKGLPPFDP